MNFSKIFKKNWKSLFDPMFKITQKNYFSSFIDFSDFFIFSVFSNFYLFMFFHVLGSTGGAEPFKYTVFALLPLNSMSVFVSGNPWRTWNFAVNAPFTYWALNCALNPTVWVGVRVFKQLPSPLCLTVTSNQLLRSGVNEAGASPYTSSRIFLKRFFNWCAPHPDSCPIRNCTTSWNPRLQPRPLCMSFMRCLPTDRNTLPRIPPFPLLCSHVWMILSSMVAGVAPSALVLEPFSSVAWLPAIRRNTSALTASSTLFKPIMASITPIPEYDDWRSW